MGVNDTMSRHQLAGKSIIVAGAGIAGLAAVRGILRNWPQGAQRPHITVYDRDPRNLPNERGNYSLGLKSDSRSGGLQALRRLGLIDQIYDARVVQSDHGVFISDRNFRSLLPNKRKSAKPIEGLPTTEMRITRNNIREVMIGAVEDEVEMKWDLICKTAAVLKNGRVEVGLSDDTMKECDLLIIADGASSKLRACLRPDDGLNYAGVVVIGGNADFPDGRVPPTLKENSGMILGGDGHSLVVWPTVDNKFVWFVTRRETKPAVVLRGDEAEAKKDELIAEALREGAIFSEPFPSLVAATDPASLKVFNAQDKPPIAHPQDPFLPYVFVGDANHAMSPFAGNGANMAIVDGAVLGEVLCKSATVAAAVAEFDKDSIPRSAASIKKSHIVISVVHASGWRHWLVLLLARIFGFFLR
ncbi:hypothetical protein LTR86_006422 [Recurvomyces mirabilis]|nr:hypothetical protein LTR86_006422 [Recurvomyces mirabilis]